MARGEIFADVRCFSSLSPTPPRAVLSIGGEEEEEAVDRPLNATSAVFVSDELRRRLLAERLLLPPRRLPPPTPIANPRPRGDVEEAAVAGRAALERGGDEVEGGERDADADEELALGKREEDDPCDLEREELDGGPPRSFFLP